MRARKRTTQDVARASQDIPPAVFEDLLKTMQGCMDSFRVHLLEPYQSAVTLLVVENGAPLPLLSFADAQRWRDLPTNVLLDLTRSLLRVCPPGINERCEILLSDASVKRGDRLTGPMIDYLQMLAEHPGQRFNPAMIENLTGNPIGPENAKQYMRRIRSRLGPFGDQMIRTEPSVTRGLRGAGPVYYANPDWWWRVISYDDRKSP